MQRSPRVRRVQCSGLQAADGQRLGQLLGERLDDGSTDLYLGPKAPEGKAGNWLATVPGKAYFAILRLYGPTEAAIDKSWKPGDIKAVK
jgi:hypothetical protein